MVAEFLSVVAPDLYTSANPNLGPPHSWVWVLTAFARYRIAPGLSPSAIVTDEDQRLVAVEEGAVAVSERCVADAKWAKQPVTHTANVYCSCSAFW